MVIVGWIAIDGSGNDAGGEFGYTPDGHSFHPVNNPEQVNCYRPRPDFVGVLKIAPILDDIPIGLYSGMPTHDDDRTTGEFWKMTVWEFWINDGAYGWVPSLDSELTFVAWIEPTVDHRGQSMAIIITFFLNASSEPGYCMNATRVNGQWDDTIGSDLKFHLDQPDPRLIRWDETTAGTWIATTDAIVKVVCLDYGAHSGSLTALATIGGENAIARLNRNGQWFKGYYYAPIPWDENNNFISDFSPYNVYHRGWYDSDTMSMGDGTLGDGFTVYEEYRGVVVDAPASGWIFLDPEVKEMFVWVNPEEFNSAEYFPGVGMPTVYLLWSLPGYFRVDYTQRVNYNVDWNSPSVNERHRRDAYAAWVIDGGSHRRALGIATGPVWSPNPRCYIYTQNIAMVQSNPQANPLGHTYDEIAKYVIGHELGHTVLWHQWDGGHHDENNPDHDELCLMWPWVPLHLGHYTFICFLPTEFCNTEPNPRCQVRWRLVE
ncbi:MAG: hypothetical protein N3B10_09420 [Armatimonadetes bacterium]|nr:hypothetical protein [Armatimonadota bacterium]